MTSNVLSEILLFRGRRGRGSELRRRQARHARRRRPVISRPVRHGRRAFRYTVGTLLSCYNGAYRGSPFTAIRDGPANEDGDAAMRVGLGYRLVNSKEIVRNALPLSLTIPEVQTGVFDVVIRDVKQVARTAQREIIQNGQAVSVPCPNPFPDIQYVRQFQACECDNNGTEKDPCPQGAVYPGWNSLGTHAVGSIACAPQYRLVAAADVGSTGCNFITGQQSPVRPRSLGKHVILLVASFLLRFMHLRRYQFVPNCQLLMIRICLGWIMDHFLLLTSFRTAAGQTSIHKMLVLLVMLVLSLTMFLFVSDHVLLPSNQAIGRQGAASITKMIGSRYISRY